MIRKIERRYRLCQWTQRLRKGYDYSQVLIDPAKAAQPPIPVMKAKRQSHGRLMEPGPPLNAAMTQSSSLH